MGGRWVVVAGHAATRRASVVNFMYHSFFLWLAFLLVVLPLLGVLYQRWGARRDARRYPPRGGLYRVAGETLHLHAMGRGAPTVVLEAGISASSLSWMLVQPAIAQFARVVSYDRAGLGWSEAGAAPCTPSRLAATLHELLQASGHAGPYILVGHSFGALIVRTFAARFPHETAGLVLVDPFRPEEWWPATDGQRAMVRHGVRLARRGQRLATLGVVRGSLGLLAGGRHLVPRLMNRLSAGRGAGIAERLTGEIRKLPREVWPVIASHWSHPKAFQAMAQHLEDLPSSVEEMAAVPPLHGVPTQLLLAGRGRGMHPSPAAYAARLGPQVTLTVAQGSGHWIQLDEPELVVAAVRALISRPLTPL